MGEGKLEGLKKNEAYYILVFVALVFFFGRLLSIGFSPDAALYAGLGLKIFQTKSFWFFGSSETLFPVFFEHPPFVFQWTALWFQLLGPHEWVAKFSGALPGFLGFCLICRWVGFRFSTKLMLLTGFMLLTFGHYTKYSTTLMLEAPLSLGAALVFIGTLEYLSSHKQLFFKSRSRTLFFLCLGLSVASASKGVVALGLWGAFIGSTLLQHSQTESFGKPFRISKVPWLLWGLSLLATLMPLLIWAIATYPQDIWSFKKYLMQQVWRSATTNRNNPIYDGHYHPLHYFWIILKYGWPWWWTVPLSTFIFVCVARGKSWGQRWISPSWSHLNVAEYKNLYLYSWIFFLCFFIPFSLTKIQLPHYLHPTYLILAPVGAVFLAQTLNFKLIPNLYQQHKVFWIMSAGLLSLTFFLVQKGPTMTKNRGQEFYHFYPAIKDLPKQCPLLVDPAQIDAYRMTAFSSWYFKNHPWTFELKAPQAVYTAIFLKYDPSYGFSILSSSTDCKEFLNYEYIKAYRR